MASRLEGDAVGLAAAGVVSGTALAALGAPALLAALSASAPLALLRRRAWVLSAALLLAFASFATRVGGGRSAPDPLATLRAGLLAPLLRSVPGDSGALAAGLTLGDDGYFSADARRSFRDSATTHLVALSGFNVALMVGALRRVLARHLSPRRFAVLACAALLAFLCVTGFQPSLLRASLAGGALLLAGAWGRRAGHARVVLLVAAAMLVAAPSFALHLGFTLSFAAAWALVATVGDVERLLISGRATARDVIVSGVIPTAVAQLAVLPVLLAAVGTVPLVGFLVNPALVPAVPALTAASWLQLLASHVSPDVATLGGAVTGAALSFVTGAAGAAASTPLAVTLPVPPLLVVAGYAAWFLLAVRRKPRLW